MSHKPTKAELKQLQELKSQLELQQKKINAQKNKLKKEKQNIEAENKKLTLKRKELERERKKFQNEKILQEKRNVRTEIQAKRSQSGAGKNKVKKELLELSDKYKKELKTSAELQKKLHEIAAQNNVLSLKLQNLSGTKKKNTTDPRLRQLIIENRELRKKFRKTFLIINKEKRWYDRSIKIFKNNQNKWIEKQRAIFKDKNIIIKYVFVDDIKYIKQYQKPKRSKAEKNKLEFRNMVKFKMKNGGETTKNGIEIIVLDPEFVDDDAKTDGGKSQASKDEEVDKLMDELMEEFGIANNEVDEEDDIKSISSDVEDIDDLDDAKVDVDDNYGAHLLQDSEDIRVGSDGNSYGNGAEIISLQKRLADMQKEIESKDVMIVSLKKSMESKNGSGKLDVDGSLEDVNLKTGQDGTKWGEEKKDANEFVFMDEYEKHENKVVRKKKKKKKYSKLNIVISQKLDIIKQEVNLGHAVTDSPFKWEDSQSKKLEKALKKKANPLKTEISLLKKQLDKLRKENEYLKKQNEDLRLEIAEK